MTQKTINLGTADQGNGDPLRVAFGKVNDNFTELYTALGLNVGGLNLGAFEFTGSVISTTDSSAIVIDQAVTVSSNLTVGGDVLPSVANGGDLGSSTLPWRSLYVSNNTIYIGGTAVGIDANGNLTTNGTTVGGSGSTLVNGANTVSLGSTGILTLPNGAVIRETAGDAVAFGQGAGETSQGNYAVAIGSSAGNEGQGNGAVAIGESSGETDQGLQAVAIGSTAGVTSQGDYAVAIGSSAGNEGQGVSAVAIGIFAGETSQGAQAVAIGVSAGGTTQGVSAVAIGQDAGMTVQGNSAVAIGWSAGKTSQGTNAVAIGYNAGLTNQGANSIILNATGAELNQTTANTFTVAPIRNIGGTSGVLQYNAATKEVTYSSDITSEGNINIEINLSDSTLRRWQFGEDGLLTLPQGGNISEGGGISGAIKLTPAGGANAYQALMIYPTAGEGDHIHLTAGGGSTELYLGDDLHYVKLASDGNIRIQADNGVNGAAWTFGTDGSLTIPGDIRSDSNINIDINLADSTLYRWQFGEDGELTLPADAVVKTTSGNLTINGQSYVYIDSASNGQINIGTSSGVGAVVLGSKSRGTNVVVDDLQVANGVYEYFSSLTDATGVVTHNCSNGHIFYHTSPDANWTVNLTNLLDTWNRSTSVTLIIAQGVTGYIPSAVQIAGVAQTIKWRGVATPTPSTNRTDVVTFSIINVSGTYIVLGQLTGF